MKFILLALIWLDIVNSAEIDDRVRQLELDNYHLNLSLEKLAQIVHSLELKLYNYNPQDAKSSAKIDKILFLLETNEENFENEAVTFIQVNELVNKTDVIRKNIKSIENNFIVLREILKNGACKNLPQKGQREVLEEIVNRKCEKPVIEHDESVFSPVHDFASGGVTPYNYIEWPRMVDEAFIIRESQGTIESHHPYHSNTHRRVKIVTPCAALHWRLIDLDLELELTKCGYDSINVFYGTKSTGYLCGPLSENDAGWKFHFGHEFEIIFKTDCSNNYYGFKIAWECVEDSLQQDNDGIPLYTDVEDSSSDSNYPDVIPDISNEGSGNDHIHDLNGDQHFDSSDEANTSEDDDSSDDSESWSESISEDSSSDTISYIDD